MAGLRVPGILRSDFGSQLGHQFVGEDGFDVQVGLDEGGLAVGGPLALVLACAGGLGTVAMAPLDDLWHRLYGRDVDIWSAPHLLALAISAVGTLGWLAATAAWERAMEPRRRAWAADIAYWGWASLLLYTGWFSLNWYQILAGTRDALLYSALVGLVLLPAVLVAGARADGRWPATTAAAAFMLLVLAPIPALGLLGWQAPALPPLLIVPAAALDLAERWLPISASPGGRSIVLGSAFGAAFLLAEAAWLPASPPAIAVASRFDLLVVGPHLARAAAWPWTPSGVVAALPVVLLASAAGAVLGLGMRAAVRRLAG